MTDVKNAGTAEASGPSLGRFVAGNPWKVIAAWIVVAFIVIATAPALPTATNEPSFLPSSYESIRAQALQAREFPQQGHVTANAGPAIASAGLILAGTFASLTLAGNQVLTQVGFAVAAGIALAAFVMAMFFSPSLTALTGRRAWWPGHADR